MNAAKVTESRYKRYKRCHVMSARFVKNLISSVFAKNDVFLASSAEKKIEWQIKVVSFYFTLLYMTGVCMAVLGLVEPQGIFYKIANAAQGVGILVVLVLYFKNFFKIRHAITLILSICTLEIAVEMVHQALYDGSRGSLSIMTNMALLACIACASTLVYVRRLSLSISALSIATYGICVYLTGCEVLLGYSYLIVFSFLCVTFMGTHLAKRVRLLLEENQGYKKEQEQFLNYMQLTKEQWRQLMEALKVTGKRVDIEQTESILTLMEERLRERLKYMTKELMKQNQDYTAVILQECPSLTELELEIANYIIKGLSSSEIAGILNTTATAITSTRSRIRIKCGLDRDINLQCYLRRLVNQEETQ